MKSLKVLALAIAFITTMNIQSAKADSEGHVLDALWKQYEAAYNADQPKKEQEILEKIRAEAVKQRLAWDFYDAVDKYYTAGVRVNWKLRDSLYTWMGKEVEAYAEPVVSYFYGYQYGKGLSDNFLKENEKALKSAKNSEFYKRDWTVSSRSYKEVLIESFANDYDYVVWSLSRQQKDSPAKSVFKDRYPLEQLLEFEEIESNHPYWKSSKERAAALEAFTQKYADKAVSLLSRQELLTDTFRQYGNEKASGKQYEELSAACAKFEQDRKASKEKTLASCCTEIGTLIKTLDSKQIQFDIKDDVLTIYLRNLASVDVVVKAPKASYKASLTNNKKSYYAKDTIKHELPPFDDGTYTVVCSSGQLKEEEQWQKYTISVVTKYDAGGFHAYAADYKTGEPVGEYKKGFLPIPNKKAGDKFSVSIDEGLRQRRSREIKLNKSDIGPYSDQQNLEAILLTDRGAFNPEETVKYKVILYRRGYNLEPVKAGQKLTVTLFDAENNEIEKQELNTGEFGSAAGAFAIPRRERNGSFTLRVKVNKDLIASKSITVDDFVLPTFAVKFDEQKRITAGDTVRFSGSIKAYSGHSVQGAEITYTLTKWGERLSEGKLKLTPDNRFEVSWPTESESYGSYQLKIKVVDGTGETQEFQQSVYVAPAYREPETRKEYQFEDLSTENQISLKAIASDKPVWAVVDLYGLDSKLIESRLVHFEPKDGAPVEQTLSYDYKKEYPDAITLSVFYFQNSRNYSRTVTLRRKDTRYDLPLTFTRFLDTTAPGASYEFQIKTTSGVECAATIFDKISETVRPNLWPYVRPQPYPVYGPRYRSDCGVNSCSGWYGGGRVMMKSANMVYAATAADALAAPQAEKEVLEADDAVESMDFDDVSSDIVIREDFSTTIAWEPFLRSDKDGNISFRFKNADKLSTFYVQLFAHDKQMRNAALRREMVVTLPVKISVLEPQYLYPEDRWNVRVSLSSNVDREIKGVVKVEGTTVEVKVPAFSQISVEVPVAQQKEDMTLTVTFIPNQDGGQLAGDAVRVKVPVLESWQTITEAHSAVLLAGADREALIADLRSRFVNLPGDQAALKEISIKEMLMDAIPEEFDTNSENCISLIRTLYAATLARKLGSNGLDEAAMDAVTKHILECRNSDGGFCWIKGFDSSPIVTAVLLDLCAGLRDRGLEIPAAIETALPAAVRFLDARQFAKEITPLWRGGLSRDLYLYVRSLYPQVKFTQKTERKWRKEVRAYLVPSSDRGLQHTLYGKARRMKTLQALSSSEEGLTLARAMGITLGTSRRIRKSLEADTRSLVQSAVKHKSGGTYFPNAVMPWRGLLESELYAHSLICDLLAQRGENELAEGVRLWLMLQKETQQWGQDPATVNALASVLDGSPETLATRVVALSGSVRKPFAQLKAAGNGFTISREWYLVGKDGRRQLSDGDTLEVGDKVVGVCSIWNEENRSFIHISVPRPACLRPQNQLSGHYGWNAFRSVRFDRTEYWFESYPEEKTAVEEAFYVTQSGVFHSAVPEIESLYAPHYRANGETGIEMITKSH